MTYEETLHYLYTSIPVFQHSGASAYKPGLDTSIALDNWQRSFIRRDIKSDFSHLPT